MLGSTSGIADPAPRHYARPALQTQDRRIFRPGYCPIDRPTDVVGRWTRTRFDAWNLGGGQRGSRAPSPTATQRCETARLARMAETQLRRQALAEASVGTKS